MKNYVKGLMSGIIIATMLLCVTSFADDIEVMFNQIRINVNGVDKAQWGV